MLHVTNGDSAAERIRSLGLPGEVLPWKDVLHDGPVPRCADDAKLRRVRARFLADCGWTEYEQALAGLEARDAALTRALATDEVQLWFEPDLYDQLQLIQALDFCRRNGGAHPVFLVPSDEFLSTTSDEQLLSWHRARLKVTEEHLEIGTRAWDAFQAPDPLELEREARKELQVLPFLAPALNRLIEEYPSTSDGLARSERQALEAVAEGPCTAEQAFRTSAAREEFAYLGDASFERYLIRLGEDPAPLIRFLDGGILEPALPDDPARSFWSRDLELTEDGSSVLDGRVNRMKLLPLERWVGGVHLTAGRPEWRREPADGTLIAWQQ